MSSKFHTKSADSYEQLMGRWSRRLAKPFLDFAGLGPGERVSMSAKALACRGIVPEGWHRA
jgi:hypothetical protein